VSYTHLETVSVSRLGRTRQRGGNDDDGDDDGDEEPL